MFGIEWNWPVSFFRSNTVIPAALPSNAASNVESALVANVALLRVPLRVPLRVVPSWLEVTAPGSLASAVLLVDN